MSALCLHEGGDALGSRAGPNALAVAAEIPCLWKVGRTAIGARPAPPPVTGEKRMWPSISATKERMGYKQYTCGNLL